MEKIEIFQENYSEADIREIIKKEGIVLKKSDRSFVKLVVYKGENLIVKNPTYKNNRKWERFLTLFKDSEAVRVIKTMKILNENQIESNIPVAIIEIRKNRMVVDSYTVFSYIEGEEIKAEDAKQVLELIKKIHKIGYLHSDTQVRNFINVNGKIATIDAKLKKKIMGKISENLEYIGFAVDIKEAYNFINMKSIWFKIAKILYKTFRMKRRVRQYFKKRKKIK